MKTYREQFEDLIQYESSMEPIFRAPLDYIPDPEWDATVQQTAWHYKLCQLLLDKGTLTHAKALYIRRICEEIERLPSNPNSTEVNDYENITNIMADCLGLDRRDIQEAGIPIWF